ncbi:S-adenosyl-L-methionine-dependent methyltransferase [Dipodascopsis uninucleata]
MSSRIGICSWKYSSILRTIRPKYKLDVRVLYRYNSTSPSTSSTQAPGKQPLSRILADIIKTTGPISVAAYMRQCLTNAELGYYINKDPFGVSGDFITSPEISQMFGELVGIWIITQWMALDRPKSCRLIELGPGRGTLMADMITAFQSFPYFAPTINEISMVDASPTLRQKQHETLCGNAQLEKVGFGYQSKTKAGIPIVWYETLKDIPNDDLSHFIIAHEFFDALPIHQFEKTPNGWRELLVDYRVPEGKTQLSLPNQITNLESKATFHLTTPNFATPSSKIIPESSSRYSQLPVNSKIEISPESWDIALDIAKRVSGAEEGTSRGSALIIDYGPADTIPVDTLRAIKKHHIVSPFDEPGTADLSADVDFTALKNVAIEHGQVDVHGGVEQGDWLHELGIGARATVLANRQKTKEGKDRIAKAYNRLVERSGGAMGKVYKVMAFVPKGMSVPVGFGGSVLE